MNGLVSLTDKAWFDHLSGLAARTEAQRLDEVNFWRPKSQQAVRSIGPGAPFFLRLKAPHHAIAGFGFFAHWKLVRFGLAWELFGDKNGAPTREGFRRNIGRLRGADPDAVGATPIGCIVLRDVVFLPPEQWLPWDASRGWKTNIVNDKSYELASDDGQLLHALIRARYDAAEFAPADLVPEFSLLDCDTRHRREVTATAREGQGTFRMRLLDAYGDRCAVTGERIVPVLDAAHIQDYLGPASNHVQNGLLLRTDLHRLYDEGLVTVTPDHEFRVSERLQDEWHNGKQYYALDGERIREPVTAGTAPNRDALAWHHELRFR